MRTFAGIMVIYVAFVSWYVFDPARSDWLCFAWKLVSALLFEALASGVSMCVLRAYWKIDVCLERGPLTYVLSWVFAPAAALLVMSLLNFMHLFTFFSSVKTAIDETGAQSGMI